MEPPTEATEVRLLYDKENIYVYARLFDNEPDKISGRYARRDDWFEGFHSSSDWFSIDFDSRHDHQTAYSFSVNSKGVQWDAMVLEDSGVPKSINNRQQIYTKSILEKGM